MENPCQAEKIIINKAERYEKANMLKQVHHVWSRQDRKILEWRLMKIEKQIGVTL